MFLGRTPELEILSAASRKKKAFITIMGRRRIGKSELIAEFARRQYSDQSAVFLKFEGAWVSKSKTRDSRERVRFQLQKFSEQFKTQLGVPIHPQNWTEALTFLQKFIPLGKKVLLFFDEISWLADGDTASFRASLKAFWDAINSLDIKIIFIIAGSVTAWIRENILEDAGFFGRVTRSIILRELPLNISSKFLGSHLSAREKITILMTMGGVPRYLEEIDPSQDSVSNIQSTFFSDGHILNTDFTQIFEHTFNRRSDTYLKIVLALIKKRPLSASEIKRAINYKSSLIDSYIKDLVSAGFLQQFTKWQIKNRHSTWQTLYQIGDNYLRFYLSYVKPNQMKIKRGVYKLTSLESLDNWDTVLGLQFENLVANSQELILSSLNLNQTPINMYGSYYQTSTSRRKGCQIDLLIETKRSIFVCEVKFKKKIGREVIKEVENKIEALHTGQNLKGLNIFLVLIYSGTLTRDLIQSDFFTHLINVEELLESEM